MSNINRITGTPRAILISSSLGPITSFSPPISISVPSNTTIVGHRGTEYPGTLLPDNGHIRLVQITTEHIGATRTVALQYYSVRLSTAPIFKALSYTWGPSSRPNAIRGICLTDNLLSALVNLAECEPQLFWIDALCINQEDLDEKPHQIRMMRDIYGKAKDVCVWLGDPCTASIGLMRKICESKEALMLTAPGMEYTDAELKRLGLPGFRDPAWSFLMRFLANPYFRRVWVLQELVMARSATVACGRLRFPFVFLQLATNWLVEKDLTSIILSQAMLQSQDWQASPRTNLNANLLRISLGLKDRGDTMFLEELLGTSRYLYATEPRDKIIGVLGLVTPDDPCKAAVNIDYRKPIAEFYRDVTGTIINTHRSLKLLSLVTDRSTSKIPGLPSWVPDYSIDVDKTSYRWAHFTRPGPRIDVKWHPGTNELHFMGRAVDEVDFVAEETASLGNDVEDVLVAWFRAAARHKVADEWAWILSLAAEDGDVDKDAEAFWRTMLLDGVEYVSPAPASYREHFAAIVFEAYLQEKSEDMDFFLPLANMVLRCMYEIIKSNPDAERDGFLDTLIQLACAAHNESREFVLPDYVIPEKWIALNEEGKYSLEPKGDRLAFLAQMTRWGGARFFITKEGRLGKGPSQLRVGDKVAVVEGTEQVFLVRGEEEEGFMLVGECYVHGLMRMEEKGDAEGWRRMRIV
jgi:hypothetical protein